MILNIEKLGAVKRAQIDLSKKFLLFCGRNSTGKTYASYILQAFLDTSSVYNLKCYKTIVEQILKNGAFKIEKEYITELLNTKCSSIKAQIGSIFGISEATCRRLFSNFLLNVEYNDNDYNNSLNIAIDDTIKEGQVVFKINKPKEANVVIIEGNTDLTRFFTPTSIRAASLIWGILQNVAFCNMSGVRMLTVERNSIYTFKTELSLSRNELIDRIQQQSDKAEIDIVDIVNSSSRRYPQAVRSSLRIANDLDNVQKFTSVYSEVAEMIEKDLLHGSVSIAKNGDVEYHAVYMPKSRRLPFHLSSSIVKTMASLVIYLRHIAQKGDTLIIDEPEMNFHPDVQVLLARIFAILTNKGLRMVVSTHSDYIVREMNNLIMGKALERKGKESLVNGLGYQSDMLLNYENIAVMFFEQTKKNSVIARPLPIDNEGFAVESIDSTILQQNKIAECLYAAISNKDE